MLASARDIVADVVRRALPLFAILLLFAACERERIVDPGPDTAPPLPPAGVVVEGARDGYVFIGWLRNQERDLRGYIVYRAEVAAGGPYLAVDTLDLNFIIDEQRSYDTTYFYFVTAFDASGNESGASDTVSATSPNRFEPDFPLQLSVNGINDGRRQMIRLSWTAVLESDLAGYRVYRSPLPFSEADSSLLIAVTDGTFFDDTDGVPLGQRYFYAVTAIDRGGLESGLSPLSSDFIARRPVLLSPPDNGKASVFPLLEWSGVPEAAEYLVSITLTEQTGEVWSGYVPGTASDTVRFRYTASALAPGSTYYWRVSTVTAGNGKPNGVSDARRFVVED